MVLLPENRGKQQFVSFINVSEGLKIHLHILSEQRSQKYFVFFFLKKWGRQRTGEDGNVEGSKKGLYLELPRKEHSSTYSKGELVY